jgi:hypothetical protein
MRFVEMRPRMAIMRICKVFCRICTKVYDLVEFQFLEADVA